MPSLHAAAAAQPASNRTGAPGAAKPASSKPPKPLSGPPLDFSFKTLTNVADALYETAESGCPARPPLVHTDPENPDETPPPPPLPPRPRAQLNAVAVRLCNNALTSLDGLKGFLEHVLDDPSQLAWLDLSCNKLAHVDDVLCDYPNLQVLYLHGNVIAKLSDAGKLAALPKLTKLTLHGNPVCGAPAYRMYLPAHLPRLKSLDFGCITKVEREEIDGWKRGHEKRLAAR